MIRVRVDVFVEVIEGGRIGLTGTRTSSDQLRVLLPRWGKGMLVGGGIYANAGSAVVRLSTPAVATINNSFLMSDVLLS